MGRRRRLGRATMGTHLVLKFIGELVDVTASWTAGTTDFQGQPIAWNYGMSWRYEIPSTGDLRSGGFFRIGSRPNGPFFFTFSEVLDTSFIPGDWTVRMTLHADRSSATGTPLEDAVNDDALVIGSMQHTGAFRVA